MKKVMILMNKWGIGGFERCINLRYVFLIENNDYYCSLFLIFIRI